MEVKNPIKCESKVDDEYVDRIDEDEIENRTKRAIEDVEAIKVCDAFFLVRTSESVYRVETSPEECECGDYEYRNTRCKHIRAVDILLPEIEEGDRFYFIDENKTHTVTNVAGDTVEFKRLLLDIEVSRYKLLKAKIAGQHGDYATEEYYEENLRGDVLVLRKEGVTARGDVDKTDVPHPDQAPEWLLTVYPGREWRNEAEGMSTKDDVYSVRKVDLVNREVTVDYEQVGSFLSDARTYDVDELVGRLGVDIEGYRSWYSEVVGMTKQTGLVDF